MFGVHARDLEYAIVKHDDTEGAERNTRCNLDFIHVVDFEVTRLFDPILQEWISQGMFGFRFRGRPLQ